MILLKRFGGDEADATVIFIYMMQVHAHAANLLKLNVNSQQKTRMMERPPSNFFIQTCTRQSARQQVVSGMVVGPKLPQQTDAKRRRIGEGRFPTHFFLHAAVHAHLDVCPSPLGG